MAGFEEILKAAGEFGRFQKCLVLLLCIPSFLISIHTFSQVFMGIPVPHHCNTSWIWKIGANLTKEQQLNLTLPRNRHGSYEECSMYTPVDWDIESIEKYGLNATEKCQDGWVYDTSEQKSTLITEFDLVCDKKEQEAISQSIFMLGLLIGALIFGPLGDRIGRRPIILLSLLLQLVFGVGAAFAPHFYVYVALRCVVGIGISGIMINNLVLVTEWVGVAQRAHATIISHIFFAIGLMVLAGLAYAIRSWRLLQLVGSLPVALVFFYIWIIPESARWLLTQGKNEKAKKLLQKAALINKQTIPEEMLQQVCEQFGVLWAEPQCGELWSGHLSYTTCVWCGGNSGSCWGHPYIGKIWPKEVPGSLSVSGWNSMLDLPVLITVLAVIGKFSIASSFSISYVYAAELFPTVVRQNGVGLSSVSARLGGIIAPLIGLLGSYHYAIPMAIFGSTPVIAAALCFLLPETHNRELQDCTEEAAVIQRSNETVNGYFKKENTKQSEGDLAALQTKSTRL
ncbi:solute carrier family 22 member 13-like isoform X2 [Rhinatrema bivittatum]|uniref:solute carrier family 22 member 13-like isoform X2 n=1 Tax=Rhinatrema bivittatum TaxID=194408 RepID=UPI00112D4450|nr:solute carrier family 22 member 13-like isoform X2 [Rhinatrema bivittatum]